MWGLVTGHLSMPCGRLLMWPSIKSAFAGEPAPVVRRAHLSMTGSHLTAVQPIGDPPFQSLIWIPPSRLLFRPRGSARSVQEVAAWAGASRRHGPAGRLSDAVRLLDKPRIVLLPRWWPHGLCSHGLPGLFMAQAGISSNVARYATTPACSSSNRLSSTHAVRL